MDNTDTVLLNEKITTILNNILAFKKIRESPAETGLIHHLEVKYFCQRAKSKFLQVKTAHVLWWS